MKTKTILTTALGVSAVATLGIAAGWRRTAGPIANPRVPQPAKPVDVTRYFGRWYELGRLENRFERGMDGVTADYALRPDGSIQVTNAGVRDGTREARRASARIVPGSANAKLNVSFFGPLYVGNYWILDRDDDYRWAIVGEPSGRFLWLLAREPDAATRDALVTRAGALGYDIALIRPTRQPA